MEQGRYDRLPLGLRGDAIINGGTGSSKFRASLVSSKDGASTRIRAEEQAVRLARSILAARQKRAGEFDSHMFGEPAWEMLLTLFIHEASGASSTIAQLEEVSGSSSRSANRWIRYLQSQGLVSSRSHPIDPATQFVELTERYLWSLRA
jgi:hypothetical protein